MPKGKFSQDGIIPLRGVVRGGKLAALLDQDGAEIGAPVVGIINSVSGAQIKTIWFGTQAQYDAIATKDANTKYITDAGIYVGSALIGSDAVAMSTVTASRALLKTDCQRPLRCESASAIVLTINNDTTAGYVGSEAHAAYQAGAGAVSFTAGSGVTLRGTPPTAAQYLTQGVMRVGANEWAYL